LFFQFNDFDAVKVKTDDLYEERGLSQGHWIISRPLDSLGLHLIG